uniref:DUF4211 domain-containing protein n=1 Tax=Trichogramma kaykai TaxID=54128 RepID=A0ABD2XHN5_9HYME
MYYKTGKEEDFSSYARKQLKRARSSTDLEEEEEASSSQPRDHDVPLDDIEENLSYDYEFFNDDAINVPDACMNDSQSIDGTKEENDYYKEINDECDIDLFQIRQRKKIKCLRDLIESEGFHDPISTPVAISQSQLLFMILKLNTCNHLSLTTLSNILSLINSIFEESILPASKYMVDKIFNNDDDVDYHITCPKCNKYLANQTIDYMLRLSSEMKTGNSIYGVKKVSALINLQYFDIIRGFVPDYMHCILCGVGKQITEYLIKSDSEFYGNLLDEIKFPYQVGRMTRPLSGRRYWKCKEWENWILYASLVLFSLKYKSPKLQYWSLLVESLHILLQENITTEELNNAEENLRQFVKKKLKMISKSKR